ncbi:MAG: hypothetical protein ACK2UH_12780 [Candidatus Promineifilaceae bacterium]|jgi:hypothetical protein
MDYGQLLRDAWYVVWNNKFLLILGFLAALGSGVSSGNNNVSYNLNADEIPPAFGERVDIFLAHFAPIVIGLMCLVVFVGVLFWLIRLTAQAGLISAADRLHNGEKVTLVEALRSGLSKLGRMIGIYLILYGPFLLLAFIMAVLVLALVGTAIGFEFADWGQEFVPWMASFGIGIACVALLLCALIPLMMVVTIILPFAQRAAVLEDMSVTDSLRRAWWVIKSNPADVIILVLLFVVVGIVYSVAVGIVLVPLIALLFVPMVIGLVVDGTLGIGNVLALILGGVAIGLLAAVLNAFWTSYRSTAMTLAYRQLAEKSP